MFISKTNKDEMNFERKYNPISVRKTYTNLLHDNLTLTVYKLYFDASYKIDLKYVRVRFRFVKHPIHTIKSIFDIGVEVANTHIPPPRITSAWIID
jgi:hypothetical protein